MASADDVQLQVLASHGPTTQFKLLLGTTKSTRDKLAAAQQINSLFLMDFAPGGTNIPHRHAKEEEIYYILRGYGDMVAGSRRGEKGNAISSEARRRFLLHPQHPDRVLQRRQGRRGPRPDSGGALAGPFFEI